MFKGLWAPLSLVCTAAVVGSYLAATSPGTSDATARNAPEVHNVRGHLSAHPPAALRPLTVRAGETVRVVGSPSTTEAPRLATVYAEVNGVPVVLTFEIAP